MPIRWDKFTVKAQEAVQRANELASEHGNPELLPVHILAALVEDKEGIVPPVLEKIGIGPQAVLNDLYRELERLPKVSGGAAQPGLSPAANQLLERAFKEADNFKDEYVSTEHLLLAATQHKHNAAQQILSRNGATHDAILKALTAVRGSQRITDQNPEAKYQALERYARDLTEQARRGKLDRVIGRDEEIRRVVQVLSRRKKNNPVLIGEPGVGKTAIVEGLAQRSVAGEVPEVLRDKRLVELSVTSLVAGTQYRGQFEERVKQLLDEVSSQQDKIILFIDELHTIVGAGSSGGEGGLDIANTFKPMLARGELHLIGATTLAEYQKHVEKDAALERRFQPVLVSEPTVEQTIIILQGLRDVLEAHHKVTILEEAIVAAAELSDRYIRGRYLPDKAIDIIDQAGARVRLRSTSRPVDIVEADAALQQVKRERDYARSRKNHDRTKELEKRLDERQKEYDQKVADWEKARRSST